MSKLRVLALMDVDFVPPAEIPADTDITAQPWRTEHDVISTLLALRHDVVPLGVWKDLEVIDKAIAEHQPHIAFNLLEEFQGKPHYDQNVVSYLELQRLAYTGCGPRGLMLARDKSLAKKILMYHHVSVPDFVVFERGRPVRRPRRLEFPLFVKSLTAEASLGISRASLVHDDEKLRERVAFIHDSVGTDALVERYIEGRELYVSILGNHRLRVFPIWELVFEKMAEDEPRFATEKAKWDPAYQKRHGIDSGPAELPDDLAERIRRTCKRVYRALDLCGYGRIDLRLTPDGRVYVLEANPNPQLAFGEDFADSAQQGGLAYDELLGRILKLGMARGVEKPSG